MDATATATAAAVPPFLLPSREVLLSTTRDLSPLGNRWTAFLGSPATGDEEEDGEGDGGRQRVCGAMERTCNGAGRRAPAAGTGHRVS
jgi:hypothetical protein